MSVLQVLAKHGYKLHKKANSEFDVHSYQKRQGKEHHSVHISADGKKWSHRTGNQFSLPVGTGESHESLDEHLSKIHSSQHSEEAPLDVMSGGKPKEGGSLLQF